MNTIKTTTESSDFTKNEGEEMEEDGDPNLGEEVMSGDLPRPGPQDEDSSDGKGSSEKEESSSSDGKGTSGGSGGGYQADDDCSSSESSEGKNGDGSSGDATTTNRKQVTQFDGQSSSAEKKLPFAKSHRPIECLHSKQTSVAGEDEDDKTSSSSSSGQPEKQVKQHVHQPERLHRNENKQRKYTSLPQWNGIRIQHPMDPRIDLSTVGYSSASKTSDNQHQPQNPHLPSLDRLSLTATGTSRQDASDPFGSSQNAVFATLPTTLASGELPPPIFPTFEQYMKLMESVRPFFHAHGITSDKAMHDAMRSDEPNSSERTSSELPTGSSDSDQRPSVAEIVDTTRNMNRNWSIHHHDLAMNATKAAVAARNDPDCEKSVETHRNSEKEANSDSSSMVVLARPKKKRSEMAVSGAPTNESSLSNTTTTNSGGSNTSRSGGSASSSEKRVRIDHQRQGPVEQGLPENDRIAMDQNHDIDNNDSGEPSNEQVDSDGADGPQESTSSSSSSGNPNVAAALPYGVPAIVSEYSSSNRNSSGASNGNQLSTSGSGSGGNTASGTGSGSGSNQGGSSGSGNDQGVGMSSNGTGSSGSGDAKGSSEETTGNSAEGNSGENSVENSDSSNKESNKVDLKDDPGSIKPGEVSHHPLSPTKCERHQHQKSDDALRERKIQDKKRKRMNMRREYEEKVEEEMASSESSCNREVVIRPGRPVTLDKVLSLSKTPRLVVKCGPPFLVIYTNASYSRLSGIDSHSAVGKPITNLLSLPDRQELSQLEFDGIDESSSKIQKESHEHNAPTVHSSSRPQNHAEAAAAGRARAAVSSREDNRELGLEPLIAACGFGKLQMINIRTKSHHMTGKNILVTKPIPKRRSQDEGSNAGSSVTSGYDAPQRCIPCLMSISPVVSTPESSNATVVTDREKSDAHLHSKQKRPTDDDEANSLHKTKRRKHHHHHQHEDTLQQHSFRTNHFMKEINKQHCITHYAIQLEPFDGDFNKFGAMGSQSSASTTVEAQMLGMTKAELRRHRLQEGVPAKASGDVGDVNSEMSDGDDGEEGDDMQNEDVSDTQHHVSAIG